MRKDDAIQLGNLIALAIVPLVMYLLSRSISLALVGSSNAIFWGMRLVDAFDLVFTVPSWAIILFGIHERLVKDTAIARGSLLLIGGYLYGEGMHIVANAINTYSTEVHHYVGYIPEDVYHLVYLFDEIVSHYVIFGALLSLYGIWIYAERERAKKAGNLGLVGGAAFLHGLSISVAMIEGQFALQALGGYVGLVGLTAILSRLSRSPFGNYLVDRPFTLFAIGVALTGIVFIVLYIIIAGGVIQPSEYFDLLGY